MYMRVYIQNTVPILTPLLFTKQLTFAYKRAEKVVNANRCSKHRSFRLPIITPVQASRQPCVTLTWHGCAERPARCRDCRRHATTPTHTFTSTLASYFRYFCTQAFTDSPYCNGCYTASPASNVPVTQLTFRCEFTNSQSKTPLSTSVTCDLLPLVLRLAKHVAKTGFPLLPAKSFMCYCFTINLPPQEKIYIINLRSKTLQQAWRLNHATLQYFKCFFS